MASQHPEAFSGEAGEDVWSAATRRPLKRIPETNLEK